MTCRIDCSVDAQYVVFGRIKVDDTWVGVGVCWWAADASYGPTGSFLGAAYDDAAAASYWVYLDDDVNGGNDVVRLADPGGETCGYDANNDPVEIYGELLNPNQVFAFLGEDGDDHIHLCSVDDETEPTAGECIANYGMASGGDGDDFVYGSAYGDYMTGAADNDEVYGWGGADTLQGGTGSDYLYGGEGDDTLDGGSGDDYLYGEADCDDLDGGTDSDECYCEDASPPGGIRYNCESPAYDPAAFCGTCS
jgi:Ca2+-binding RTX toxin-like protein